jgi:two-component system response regulator RegA
VKILLLEDDAVFAGVLTRSLQRRGHEVTWVSTVTEAEQCAGQLEFTHAVFDLKLAEETSLPFIPVLLSMQPDIRILLLTGFASIHTAVQAVKLGAVNYLCKPADTDSILAALTHTAVDVDVIVPLQPLSVDRLEWEHIQRVMAEHGQNVSATARALGMHRRTLQRKLAKRPSQR